MNAKIFVRSHSEYRITVCFAHNEYQMYLYLGEGDCNAFLRQYIDLIKNKNIVIFQCETSHNVVGLIYDITKLVNPNITMSHNHSFLHSMVRPNLRRQFGSYNLFRMPDEVKEVTSREAEQNNSHEQINESINESINEQNNEQNNIHAQNNTHVQDNNFQLATIKRLVKVIHELIKYNHISYPNFEDSSRMGTRRLKNFIHNLTKVWLNQESLKLFRQEYARIC